MEEQFVGDCQSAIATSIGVMRQSLNSSSPVESISLKALVIQYNPTDARTGHSYSSAETNL
jgi:hypothetical protein